MGCLALLCFPRIAASDVIRTSLIQRVSHLHLTSRKPFFVQTLLGQLVVDAALTDARVSVAKGISILGSSDSFLHQYAKCCNPIPGDAIIGFVTIGEGIKIHRKDCKNVVSMRLALSERVVEVGWPSANGADFIAAITISGNDRPGLLSDITHAISSYQNTNIRSVNVDSKDQMFTGQIILYVKNTDHLGRILEKIRRVAGVALAERFLG